MKDSLDRTKLFLKELELVKILIGVNTFLFLAANALSFVVGRSGAIILLGGDSLLLVLNGEVWRWITSGFLHIDIIHFGFNMYALWTIGMFVEKFYSAKKLFLVLVLAILSGSLLSNIFDVVRVMSQAPGTGASNILSLGASGGIFGLIGLLIGTSFFDHRNNMELPIDRAQLLYIAAINLLIGAFSTGIDNFAHIGGLIAGVALSFFIHPWGSYEDLAHTLTGVRSVHPFLNFSFYSALVLTVLCFFAQFVSVLVNFW